MQQIVKSNQTEDFLAVLLNVILFFIIEDVREDFIVDFIVIASEDLSKVLL